MTNSNQPSRTCKRKHPSTSAAVKHIVIEPLEDRRLLTVTVSTVCQFTENSAFSPPTSLIADLAGNLYGVTTVQKPSSTKVQSQTDVFEIPAGTQTIIILAKLRDGTG